MFNITSKYLAFSTISHLQTESRIPQENFLHVVPVRIIVPWYDGLQSSLLSKMVVFVLYLYYWSNHFFEEFWMTASEVYAVNEVSEVTAFEVSYKVKFLVKVFIRYCL